MDDWQRTGFHVGVVHSARSRLSPKRLSDRMDAAKEKLQEIGGGERGLMQGADQILPQGEVEYYEEER